MFVRSEIVSVMPLTPEVLGLEYDCLHSTGLRIFKISVRVRISNVCSYHSIRSRRVVSVMAYHFDPEVAAYDGTSALAFPSSV